MRFDPCDFILVRPNAVEIGAVGPRKQVSRLKEVNVRVDVTGQNEFAHATDLSSKRGGILFSHRDALDLVAVDHDGRIRQHFAVGGINHSGANERNLFGADVAAASEEKAQNSRQARDSTASLETINQLHVEIR